MKSIWIKKGKDHILITRNDLNNWKISLFFFFILEFQKIVQNFDKMSPEGNFERQFETLDAKILSQYEHLGRQNNLH